MIESNENSNQVTNRMPYLVRFVNWPIQSGSKVSWLQLSKRLSKRGERRLESLLDRNPHSLHARASCDCKAVSRSFPYAFHLPSLQHSLDMVAVRDLQKRRKDIVSKQSQLAPPQQPLASRPTSLRIKLEGGGK